MATTISTSNVNKLAPTWYRRLKRFVTIGAIPVVVIALKTFWEGPTDHLDKVLVLVTTIIPGALEAFGLLLTDEDETPPA